MVRGGVAIVVAVAAAVVMVACATDGVDTVDDAQTPVETPTPPDSPDATPEPEPEPVQRRAADLPGPRTEVTGTVWDGRIVAVGGLDETGAAMANVDVYDPADDTWTRAPDLPGALHHTATATLDGRVYVVGGYSIQGRTWVAESAVWSLGPGEDSWRPEPALRTARGALAVASTGERIVAIGGVDANRQVLTSTEVLLVGADEWAHGPDLAVPREHLAATAVGDEVYAIAGRAGGFATNRDSVEVLRDDAWHDAGTLNASRGGIGAATVHDMPCVTGGEEDAGTIGSVECLVDGAWQVVAELEVPRHGLVVAAIGRELHVIGGGPEPGLTVSDVHEVVPIPIP